MRSGALCQCWDVPSEVDVQAVWYHLRVLSPFREFSLAEVGTPEPPVDGGAHPSRRLVSGRLPEETRSGFSGMVHE
jgi:hypothetical protein